MSADPSVVEFIERAHAAGIPHESLVGVLKAYGWPEREIYDALGPHYRSLTGIDIPRRPGVKASARDAFFYLLLFSTLATWTIGFGSLAFVLIDRWLADPLFSRLQISDSSSIASATATLLVAYPLFLLVSRIVTREASAHPEKLESPIRKWLTYMALVIAACVFMGDLITSITYLLRGELTSRFFAKSVVVLALSGGIVWFYFDGLRRPDLAPGRLNRDRLMAALSAAAVALALVLGLWQLGPPRAQRSYRADEQRIQQLYQLSLAIKEHWTTHQNQLPSGLNQLAGGAAANAVTLAPVEYHPKQAGQYELCADFARGSEGRETAGNPDIWVHPAGHHCFMLDASLIPQMPRQLTGDAGQIF